MLKSISLEFLYFLHLVIHIVYIDMCCKCKVFSTIIICFAANPEFSESFSESSIESFHPRFEFRNQVAAHAEAPGGSLTSEGLHDLLKRILFEPEGTDL